MSKRYNYAKLLEDKDFKRWYDNVRRGSIAVADERLRRIGYVCRVFNKTTRQLAKMKERPALNFILDVISHFEQMTPKRAGSYIGQYVKALKSWFKFNGTDVKQRIRIPDRGRSVKYANEKVPMQEELKSIFNAGDHKEKTACSLISLGGVRPEVMGDFLGDDGLKVEDLPEMVIDNDSKTVTFTIVPTMIVVREELSKAGHQYFTFLPEEGCQYLKEYLEARMRDGEELGPKSPIITPAYSGPDNQKGNHIRTTNISDTIRVPIREAGFKWRPYVLRRYFDTRLMIAEQEGLIIRDFRVFWMGHKGDIEHTYTLNKQLPKDVMEKIREAYRRAADKHLVTWNPNTMSRDTVLATFNMQFLEMGGYTKEELSNMGDLAELTPARLNELLQQKQREKMGLNGNSQKVVPMEDVENWIAQGWEYIAPLPPNKAIVKLPKMIQTTA